MRVLGLTTEGDSGATVVEDGRLLAAVNEERLARMKLVVGVPRGAIREVLRISGTAAEDIDSVLIATRVDGIRNELEPFDGWMQGPLTVRTRLAGTLAPYRNALPFLEHGYYAMQMPRSLHRRRALKKILREEFDIAAPVRFVDHHLCHLTSAYYTSGFDEALVISVDGGGDGKSSRVYAVRGGQWTELGSTSAYNSLGNYYAYVTHIAGFKAQKHEGKITGLAAHGEPRYVPLLKTFIDEEGGSFVNRGSVAYHSALQKLERSLPTGWTREDLAASIQRHFEDVVARFVRHWARTTGLKNVALAGGVFANVRVNQVVHELPEIDRIFVHPHMADGGLGGGAALAACIPGIAETLMRRDPEPLRDVYLGPELSDAEIEASLKEARLTPEPRRGMLAEKIADLLCEGYVVARAAGRMEYGPRALGNRSILYHPTDRRVNDWLNQNLHRTEFMPFAPSTLYEARNRCFERVDGAEHTAEFMTITFDCTPWMRENLAGVVHIDGTARPQLVRSDRNAGYYAIIEAFRRRTGLPAIINTSFNMHEEPIVCSAQDCVRAFLDGNLDYLAIGDHLVKHPAGVSHELVPVRPAATVEAFPGDDPPT